MALDIDEPGAAVDGIGDAVSGAWVLSAFVGALQETKRAAALQLAMVRQ